MQNLSLIFKYRVGQERATQNLFFFALEHFNFFFPFYLTGTKQSTRRKKSKYDKALSSMQEQCKLLNDEGNKNFQEMLLEQMRMQQEWEDKQREKDKEERRQFQQELMQAERATLLEFGNMLKGLFQVPLHPPQFPPPPTYPMHRPDMEMATPRRFTPSPQPRRISPDGTMFGSALSDADASLRYEGL